MRCSMMDCVSLLFIQLLSKPIKKFELSFQIFEGENVQLLHTIFQIVRKIDESFLDFIFILHYAFGE